ncbi:hypothetical protein HYC85_023955 [Camellia sinensis]|uniref:BED-type domain-containing protein n=1 Tax=Camellia sinensis TaxID=4442 RepID=A0A7J7GJU2_CAMSI|nr:hypothetical protein HYC85_023955 [Camellia sinensis]
MSNRQLHLTSPEQDSCTPFSSFEESSIRLLMDNSINDVVNDVNADVEVDVDDMIEIEDNERDNEEAVNDKNPFEKKSRTRTSQAWKEFTEVVLPDGTKKAQCQWCKTQFAIHATGATTQLLRHLKKNYVARKLAEKKQKVLSFSTIGSDNVTNASTFTYDHAKIYPEVEATRNISMVREALYELYNEYVSIHTSSNTEKSFLHNTRATGSSSSMQGVRKSVVTRKSKFESFVRKADTIQPVKSDLDISLEEGVYICNEDSNSYFDALEWWKVNYQKFHILSKMACHILSVPITSVASESTFSAGGRVIDPYRA